MIPYQFTGNYTDGNTGLVQMDARWYNPYSSRFQQPDYWNLRNTHLPAEIMHELMRFTGLNTNQLLNIPSQQLSYGYVSGNPLRFVDPFGLAVLLVSEESTIGTGVLATNDSGLAFSVENWDLKIHPYTTIGVETASTIER